MVFERTTEHYEWKITVEYRMVDIYSLGIKFWY